MQKALFIKHSEAGIPTPDICRKTGLSYTTTSNCKKRYGGLMKSEMQRLKYLKNENARR
tara:strand:+ start:7446 stop:7622 length:177 start_codon:yes stop_codon:yes gene_type:complete